MGYKKQFRKNMKPGNPEETHTGIGENMQDSNLNSGLITRLLRTS